MQPTHFFPLPPTLGAGMSNGRENARRGRAKSPTPECTLIPTVHVRCLAGYDKCRSRIQNRKTQAQPLLFGDRACHNCIETDYYVPQLERCTRKPRRLEVFSDR